ncbi:uncharacterized protein LOC129299223 isoform X2 [Prosopis cineraria]|uniref:uncharacterized protein LOC129299223 isoform X2 n=1 Tax=Prosopis cineraria TaxID=364024 RepID=UPI00241089A6|nr:uncharacterized protein LOC129299223 isoform X2 [Prosopis cineraria]
MVMKKKVMILVAFAARLWFFRGIRLMEHQKCFCNTKGSDEPDRFDLLRNHRDAWTYGEEFGMIASFALVGQIQINLMSKDVLNIYCVVQGFGDLFASYTPQLDNIVLEENTKKVKDPDFKHTTAYENKAAVNGSSNEFHLSCALWKMSSFT